MRPLHGAHTGCAPAGRRCGPRLIGRPRGRLVGIVVAAMLESRAAAFRLAAEAAGPALERRLVLYLPVGSPLEEPGFAAFAGR